jgi:hypothetical protein
VSLFLKSNAVAQRDRQLAELLQAVNQAEQLAITLCNSPGSAKEAQLLFGRLERVREEVEHLQIGSGAVPFDEIDPKWTGLPPWRTGPGL